MDPVENNPNPSPSIFGNVTAGLENVTARLGNVTARLNDNLKKAHEGVLAETTEISSSIKNKASGIGAKFAAATNALKGPAAAPVGGRRRKRSNKRKSSSKRKTSKSKSKSKSKRKTNKRRKRVRFSLRRKSKSLRRK